MLDLNKDTKINEKTPDLQIKKTILDTFKEERNERFKDIDKDLESGALLKTNKLYEDISKHPFNVPTVIFIPVSDMPVVLRLIEKEIETTPKEFLQRNDFYDSLFMNFIYPPDFELKDFQRKQVYKELADFMMATKGFAYVPYSKDTQFSKIIDLYKDKRFESLTDFYNSISKFRNLAITHKEYRADSFNKFLNKHFDDAMNSLFKVKNDMNLTPEDTVVLLANNLFNYDTQTIQMNLMVENDFFNKIINHPEFVKMQTENPDKDLKGLLDYSISNTIDYYNVDMRDRSEVTGVDLIPRKVSNQKLLEKNMNKVKNYFENTVDKLYPDFPALASQVAYDSSITHALTNEDVEAFEISSGLISPQTQKIIDSYYNLLMFAIGIRPTALISDINDELNHNHLNFDPGSIYSPDAKTYYSVDEIKAFLKANKEDLIYDLLNEEKYIPTGFEEKFFAGETAEKAIAIYCACFPENAKYYPMKVLDYNAFQKTYINLGGDIEELQNILVTLKRNEKHVR